MSNKKILVAGLPQALVRQVINQIEGEQDDRKHLEVWYRDKTIEIPQGYLENTWMQNQIITIGQNQAHTLIFLLSIGKRNPYSYGFAQVYNASCYGFLTETEGCTSVEIAKGKKALEDIGVKKAFLYPSAEANELLQTISAVNQF